MADPSSSPAQAAVGSEDSHEQLRRRATQLQVLLALASPGRHRPRSTRTRSGHSESRPPSDHELLSISFPALAARRPRRQETQHEKSPGSRARDARADRQLEVLLRIDDNLRRLRQLAETREGAQALFTAPER